MPGVADKVMFEVYRDASYDRLYQVVYFTELDEHNKVTAIARAMAGEHVYDGFLAGARLADGKRVVRAWTDRWNEGEPVDPDALEADLMPYLAADAPV